jgi:hypothetical protein
MNQHDVAKRELLDYSEFLKKVHDDTYKPFSAENQTDQSEKTGLSKIKREQAYDFVGYADSVFAGKSKIDTPALVVPGDSGTVFDMDTNESKVELEFIKKLEEF